MQTKQSPRSVTPAPGKRLRRIKSLRKLFRMITHDGLRGFVKIASSTVVAESFPEPQHVIDMSRRKRRHVGKFLREALKYGTTAATVVCCSMISLSQMR